MKPCDPVLRVPADFLREARRLFGRLRQPPGRDAAFPVEACGGFEGITLAAGDGHCRLETFRPATMEAGGSGCLLLSRQALADACRADPGTMVELAACRQPAGILLRLRCGGIRMARFHPASGGQPLPAPALPEGQSLRLPARGMEALAAVAPFADWQAPAGPWGCGVRFSPEGGGCLIAGDGRRLARVPLPGMINPFDQPFVLRLGAVRVLLHAEFQGCANEVVLPRPGGPPWILFRAWEHQLLAPVLPAGMEDRPWRGEEAAAVHRTLLDEVQRLQLLAWLRALRDPRVLVTLEWRKGGKLRAAQGRGGGARLRLDHGNRGGPPCFTPLRLFLPPRDLAAMLNLGGRLGVGVESDGSLSLHCHGSEGVFCKAASLADGHGERRPAAGSKSCRRVLVFFAAARPPLEGAMRRSVSHGIAQGMRA